jgi:hypothetical protein
LNVCQLEIIEENMPTFQVSPQFLARQQRLEDAFNLKKPDRVPVAPVSLHYYPTRVKGISNKDSMYHWDKRLAKLKEVTIQHDWDAAPPAAGVSAAQPWDLLGFNKLSGRAIHWETIFLFNG